MIVRLFMLLLALTLILSACNPRQAAPPEADTNLVTAVPVGNYDGGDETIYFLTQAPDGTETRFEAGFIKDGKLTLNPENPPVELQQLWIDTLPANTEDLEYSDGAETAMAVHVTAILIGDTGLMVTGRSGLAPASGSIPADLTGLTWTSEMFTASWYLSPTPKRLGLHVDASYSNWVAYGLTGPSQSTTMDLSNFMFDASYYAPPEGPAGLQHPFFYPTLPDPEDPETPGDESPEDPGDENPEDPETPGAPDPETPGDNEPEDPEAPGAPDPKDPETPGAPDPEDPEAPEPVEVKAVINAPDTALTGDAVSFTAAGSTGQGELTYAWNFGDGTDIGSSTEASPTYAYQAAYAYTVKLTVTDEAGATGEATAVIIITDPISPAPSGFQVQGYTGPGAPVGFLLYNEEGNEEDFIEFGSITSTGWLTFNFETHVPAEYLQPVNNTNPYCSGGPCDMFPPGSVDNPNASMVGAPALMINGPTMDSLFAVTNEGMVTGETAPQDGDAMGMFVYADQPVSIITNPSMSGHPNYQQMHLELDAGWNFAAQTARITDDDFEVFITNADPADFTWLVIPAPQPESITFEEPEARELTPSGGAIPGVLVHYDNGTSDYLSSHEITWSSNHPEIASVEEGIITAHSYGTATITAEYMGLTASLEVIIDSVVINNSPARSYDVTASHYAGSDGAVETFTIGYLSFQGLLTFYYDMLPELTPITDTRVIDSSLADNQNANLAFVYELSVGDVDRIWIGNTNSGGSGNPGHTSGQLWYSDQPVRIESTGTPGEYEHFYDVTLKAGWNLVTLTATSFGVDGRPLSFNFKNAPMNGVLDWTYEEPTHLIITPERIDATPETSSWYRVRVDMSYPSGVGYINQDNLEWSTSDNDVAIYNYDEALIHVVGNGEAILTVTDPTTDLQGSIPVTGSGFLD